MIWSCFEIIRNIVSQFAPSTLPPPITQPWVSHCQTFSIHLFDFNHCFAISPPTQAPTTIRTTLSTTITTVALPNDVNCPENGVTKTANPFSCTRYYMCYDGVAVTRTCSPGLYFSRSQLRCVRRADSDCLLNNESCPIENDPRNVVFLPDQDDCQRFEDFSMYQNLF